MTAAYLAAAHSSAKTGGRDDWATPDHLYEILDARFNFTIDAAASGPNAKNTRFWTKEDDALAQSWLGERVFCNPPYSEVAKWAEKASEFEADVSVLLVKSATDTRWFHHCVDGFAKQVFFIKGRLTFIGAPSAAPFPSMVAVYGRHAPSKTEYSTMILPKVPKKRGPAPVQEG